MQFNQLDYIDKISPLKDEAISVSQLNKMAKSILENQLPIMWIRGEISGLKTYSHLYFDLKDEAAKVSCVMFAKLAGVLDFPLENGIQVEVRGRVTIYPQNGSYQINVERVRKVGLGELWEAYAKLINKLRDEGLFESKYKKSIPTFPRSIGVITSKEGAVIRDVLTTLKRRMPNIPVIIYHSAVQGSDASMQLVRAIRTANARNEVDVLIVCRGGGSMEDLWCFNEEVVAREVFASSIPIISAVGHETDTTIIDFVSDLRAPTPTAAAELVAKSRQEWLDKLNRLQFNLSYQIDALINQYRQRLDLANANLRLLNPLNRFEIKKNTITQLGQKLERAFDSYLQRLKWRLELNQSKIQTIKLDSRPYWTKLSQLENSLNRGFTLYLKQKFNLIERFSSNLNLINPENVLTRGYAIIYDSKGKIIQSVKHPRHHERIQVKLADGDLSVIVDKKHNNAQGELI